MAKSSVSANSSGPEKAIPALNNVGYFSDYYLAHRLDSGLADLYARWDQAEKQGEPTDRTRLRGVSAAFGRLRAGAALTAPTGDALDADRLDLGQLPPDGRDALLALNEAVLEALGWTPERGSTVELTSGDKTLTVPVAHRCETPTGVLLVALDTVFASDPAAVIGSKTTPAGRLIEPLLVNGKPTAHTALDAAQLIFTADEAPSFVLFVSGGAITLLDRDRWGEGVSLGANLDDALARHDTKPKGELAAISALFGAGAINPGDEAQSILTRLLERANTESAGVSKELRHGIRRSIELLANAVVADIRYRRKGAWTTVDPRDLTRQSLRYLYRVIVLLFAEARPELGILPSDDPDYQAGYSMARLRDTALVELHSDHARNARHLQRSLDVLFGLVNEGYSEEQTLDGDDLRELRFPGLRSALFSPTACPLIDQAHLTDEVLQQVIANLCFTREKVGSRRQAVSYSTLGINQLGAVYEGLTAYSGFLATEPLFEVDKDGNPDSGSWVIPVDRADEFPEDAFLTEEALDGSTKRVRYEVGDFVFRLSGRDRQRSASYYTPEVLTEFTVRHALDVLFDENPGLTAADVLQLTVCEPALGSGAFANEAINQLAARYLKMAQDERGETIDADRYQSELQKAKAHFAVNQVFGVDLNQTAVELAEVSLWLNCMHEGLRAPWFGGRLRRGNSLIGARRATYSADQVLTTVWKGKTAVAPADQPLATVPFRRAPGIHHFLLPGEGWGAAAASKEIKEIAPDWADAVKKWQRRVHAKPTQHQVARLEALATRVEELWERSAVEVSQFWDATRQHIDLWGNDTPREGSRFGDAAIRRALHDPLSATFRLRAAMNAWCSLWLWAPEHGMELPSFDVWLSGLEALLRVDDRAYDVTALFRDEREVDLPIHVLTPATEAIAAFPWLATCQQIAEAQGWFHWALEFAPVFQNGGFSVVVGNPPWVEPEWNIREVLGEHLPELALSDSSWADIASDPLQRADAPLTSSVAAERAENAGIVALLGSANLSRNLLRGLKTNLANNFIIQASFLGGINGILHPEIPFSSGASGPFRAALYPRLRRLWHFKNEAKLFTDVHNQTSFLCAVYGSITQGSVGFVYMANAHLPVTIDRSLQYVLDDDLDAPRRTDGSWNRAPHSLRVINVDHEALTDWARFQGVEANPLLMYPYSKSDQALIKRFAESSSRLNELPHEVTLGFDETKALRSGKVKLGGFNPSCIADWVIQGPHFSVANPLFKSPNRTLRSNKDWSRIDLTEISSDFIPDSKYRPGTLYRTLVRLGNEEDDPTTHYRLLFQRKTSEDTVRSLQTAIIPPSPYHTDTPIGVTFMRDGDLLTVASLTASIVYDFILKIRGIGTLNAEFIGLLPMPPANHPLAKQAEKLILRLNCVTSAYSDLWKDSYPGRDDDGRIESIRVTAGPVPAGWSHEAALRDEHSRWGALCDLDAIAALRLGLRVSDLRSIYRSQFGQLRMYESNTVFDSLGRQLSSIRHNWGIRQHLAESEKTSPAQSVWPAVEQWLTGREVPVPYGFSPPFTRADREAAMSTAYWAYVDKYGLTPPDIDERPA